LNVSAAAAKRLRFSCMQWRYWGCKIVRVEDSKSRPSTVCRLVLLLRLIGVLTSP
jgi:hypothetical protein